MVSGGGGASAAPGLKSTAATSSNCCLSAALNTSTYRVDRPKRENTNGWHQRNWVKTFLIAKEDKFSK